MDENVTYDLFVMSLPPEAITETSCRPEDGCVAMWITSQKERCGGLFRGVCVEETLKALNILKGKRFALSVAVIAEPTLSTKEVLYSVMWI